MEYQDILSRMTLKDKIALCSGQDFWHTKAMEKYGIPAVFMCDGPHGLRKQERGADMLGVHDSCPATCFPTAASTACSWDMALLEELGQAIGEEAREQGVDMVLGPGANIKRNPLCGRNFEYFSEDPYLSGKLAAGEIRGLQKNGIAASLKHFACNSQEYKRFSSDSVLDERTLRELYLTAFEIAVREGTPASVMCAYNKVNGVFCSENYMLLTDVLRKEWGFDGLVITDWGGMHDRIESFRAGCDLSMPGGSAYMERAAWEAVKQGKLREKHINACAARVLRLALNAAQNDHKTHIRVRSAHRRHELARRIAGESGVLLRNEEHVLPLRFGQTAVLIGSMAAEPRYQGAGSSHINPTCLVSAVEAMPEFAYVQGCRSDGSTDEELLEQAAEAARAAQTAVVFAGLPAGDESEGFDRAHMGLPEGHCRLIRTVSEANCNTVVVLFCGGAVECPWADQVKGILYMGLPGQAGGEAVADLLLGRVNPSGKLAETWPLSGADCPSMECYGSRDGQYREGLYVGYRYYDKAGKQVRWPFGYGLSYTRFSYADMNVSGDTVSVLVKNEGSVAGAEVVQLYIEAPAGGLHRPLRELKGFQKLYLQPGEYRRASFTVNERSFALWANGWKIPGGTYTVRIGASSRELPLSAEIVLDGQDIPAPEWQEKSWYQSPCGAPERSQWERLLGKPYKEPVIQKGKFTRENTVAEMREQSWVMGLLFWGMKLVIARGVGKGADESDPRYRMLMSASTDSSLSNLQICGGIKGGLLEGLLEMANGRFGRGLMKMLKRRT